MCEVWLEILFLNVLQHPHNRAEFLELTALVTKAEKQNSTHKGREWAYMPVLVLALGEWEKQKISWELRARIHTICMVSKTWTGNPI